MFSLSSEWQAITDPVDAKRIAAEARVAQKRKPQVRERVRCRRPVEPDPVEVEREPEPKVRPITLPMLAWPTNPSAGR